MKKVILFLLSVILTALFFILLFQANMPVFIDKNIDIYYHTHHVNTRYTNSSESNNLNNPYTFLESKEDDSDLFGSSLAVSKDYLAVSDPKANRVVIYGRQSDGNWSRLYEIYPPKRPVTEYGGYTIRYELALKDNLLLIHAYDFQGTDRHWLYGTWLQEQNGDESVYLIPLNPHYIKTRDIMRIRLPKAELYYRGAKLLGDKVALIVRVKGFFNKFSNHLFLLDSAMGKMVKNIKLDSQFKLDKERLVIDSNNNLLIFSFRGLELQENFPLSISADGKIDKIALDKKVIDSVSVFRPPSAKTNTIAFSDNLLAIGTTYSLPSSSAYQTMFWKRFPKLSIIPVTKGSVPYDVRDSSVLLSYIDTRNQNKLGYVFIQVDENKIVTKSKIRWEHPIKERGSYYDDLDLRFTPINGLIDSDSLLLSAYGTVVRFPLKNLPSSYEIKHSNCRSK